MEKENFLKRRCLSFKFAIRGIFISVKSQLNMKIHIIAAILAILIGIYLEISNYEWLIIILVIGLVFSTEMINTSIEALVDLVSPAYHKSAEKAKDISAGAVLISAIIALIAGIIIFVPKILILINH